MIRSLGLKLALLVLTMGVVYWIRWQPAELQPHAIESNEAQSVAMAPSIAGPPSPTIPVSPPASLPRAGSTGGSDPVGGADHTTVTLVDLNRATAHELESLPGIGAVLAQRVIEHRTSVGRFLAVEDLREVKGIGAKKFEQIKSLVTVAKGEAKGKTEKRPS